MKEILLSIDGTLTRPVNVLGAIIVCALPFAGCAASSTQSHHHPIASQKQNTFPQSQLTAVTPQKTETEKTTFLTTNTVDSSPSQQKINQKELENIIKLGAQHFISLIDVRPAFKNGRFWGWRILDYRGPGNLLPNDIIIRINNLPIERPEQFMRVWNMLPHAKYLIIDMMRKNKRIQFHYPIVR